MPLQAQDELKYTDPEAGFSLMRSLATGGDYKNAKFVGYQLIEENPDYYDAALYLARIHGWESGFDSAYMVLDEVISRAPELYEAYETCAQLAYWENNPGRLETCSERAVALEPDSAAQFERYAMALRQGRSDQKLPQVFAHYSFDHFSLPYVRNWHMLTVGGSSP